MNRQRSARFHISSLHIQQSLWAALALLVTLVVGQQWLLWQESQRPEAPAVSIHRAAQSQQSHFSAVGNVAQASASMRMIEVDQAQPVTDTQERWVF